MLDVTLFQRASAGNFDALVALITAAGPSLRLAIAAHSPKTSIIPVLERAIWSVIRQQLPMRDEQVLPEEWLARLMTGPIRLHLQTADQQAITATDMLSHQVVQDCLSAIDRRQESGVNELAQRIAALDAPTRQLIERRYRDRQSLINLAAGHAGGQSAVANALWLARAHCDWRGIARISKNSDSMMPALLEEWLSDTIDRESRALLAINVGRDLDRAAQVLRQIRVHVALDTFYRPFTASDAQSLAGVAIDAVAQRVVIGAAPTSLVPSRTSVKASRPSGRSPAPILRSDEGSLSRSSPMPWIISGILVLGGIIGLIALSFNRGPSPVQMNSLPPISSAVPVPTANAPNRSSQAPGTSSSNKPVDPASTEFRVSMLNPSTGPFMYAKQTLTLRAMLSRNDGIERVEFLQGDMVIGTATTIPWSCQWVTQVGQHVLMARAVSAKGVSTMSQPETVMVKPAFGSGSITREWWTGIHGDIIAHAASLADWPASPHGRDSLTSFSAPREWGDYYIQHIRGYVVPPIDGNYIFWIDSDDEGELWLSANDSPLLVQRIAHDPWTASPVREITENGVIRSVKQSAAIALKAEQRYYIEVRQKEGAGEDFVMVGWQLPNGEMERPIPGSHLSPIRGDEPPAAIPRPILAAPVPAPVAVVNVGPVGEVVLLWNGEEAAGGASFKGAGSERLDVIAEAGRIGKGIRFTARGQQQAHYGWNWHSWTPADAGTNISGCAAFVFSVRMTGEARPTRMSAHLVCSPGDKQGFSQKVELLPLVPNLMNGEWHRVEIPIALLVPAGHEFNLTKTWGATFELSRDGSDMQVIADFDDLVAVKNLSGPSTPTMPAVPVEQTWRVVRAINLGGEGIEIAGQKWTGHRQAEIDGTTPVNSVQPGPFLDELPWMKAIAEHGGVQRNQSTNKKPIILNGRRYVHGLGVHAKSEIEYALNGQYLGLTAEVGVDDEIPDTNPDIKLLFEVYADDKKIWESGEMGSTSPTKRIEVPLIGCKVLRLVVEDKGNGSEDFGNWADARFIVKGGNDGNLLVRNGRRTTKSIAPKVPVEAGLRTLLSTVLVGTKEGLSFSCKAENGPARVSLWIGENGISNSRSYALDIEGQILESVGEMAMNEWKKIGPIDVIVSGGYIDIVAKPIKGIPQVMGILIEAPEKKPAP